MHRRFFNYQFVVKTTTYINQIDYVLMLNQIVYWPAQQIYIEKVCHDLMTSVIIIFIFWQHQ